MEKRELGLESSILVQGPIGRAGRWGRFFYRRTIEGETYTPAYAKARCGLLSLDKPDQRLTELHLQKISERIAVHQRHKHNIFQLTSTHLFHSAAVS